VIGGGNVDNLIQLIMRSLMEYGAWNLIRLVASWFVLD
jgi:hypothetical protein